MDTVRGRSVTVIYHGHVNENEQVSVRGYVSHGLFEAERVHQMKRLPVHTILVRGQIASVVSDLVRLKIGRTTFTVEVLPTKRVSVGTVRSNDKALKSGEQVSVRFWYQGSARVATSIHIYASAVGGHAYTGTIVMLKGLIFEIALRNHPLVVHLSPSVVIQASGQPIRMSGLVVGDRVRITGLPSKGGVQAIRVDVLPLVPTLSGHMPISFRGAIRSLRGTHLLFDVTGFGVIPLTFTGMTRVFVDKRSVPNRWLFAGPVANVSVSPRPGRSPRISEVAFRPKTRSVTGDIASISRGRMLVESSSGLRSTILLTVAQVTVDGGPASVRAIHVGEYVRVRGFVLPHGSQAALLVAISHPNVRVSGTVARATSREVSIVRTNGQRMDLRFGNRVRAFARKTGQWFPSSRIPFGSRLRVRGIQQAGWIAATSASLTLKSSLMRGTVLATSTRGLTLSTGTGAYYRSCLAADEDYGGKNGGTVLGRPGQR